MSKLELKIDGMHCKGCELGLEETLEELDFVKTVKADCKKGIAIIEHNESKLDMDKIKNSVKQLGFHVIE